MRDVGKIHGNSHRSEGFLFIAALIWGTAFVAQRIGMDAVGPFTFNAVRNLVGAVSLLPLLIVRRMYGLNSPAHTEGEEPSEVIRHGLPKTLLLGGFFCGFFLCLASNLQQVGILYTTVGKAGFITALYIVMVPLLGILIGRTAGKRLWLSIGLAVFGMYNLCMTESLVLSKGDLLTLLCALAFAFQILSVDHFSRECDNVALAFLEFLVCGLLSLIPMFLLEQPTFAGLWEARIPILYTGMLSCGVAYTLQIIAQKGMNPAVASLIMSLESVISALAAWLILHQTLSIRELFGCAVIFAAILLAQTA